MLNKLDHTLLTTTATSADFIKLCREGLKHNVASVCVPPSRVALCYKEVGGLVPICTVIGFPNGYNTTESKVFEAEQAIKHGASEIDMVINPGHVRDKDFELILEEIKSIRKVTLGCILKVIIETCQLTTSEKIALCEIVSKSGADYIKTSTGFNKGGATFGDIELIKKHVSPEVKIKAAGGIETPEDAEEFIKLGASRLGTSKLIKIIEGGEAKGY